MLFSDNEILNLEKERTKAREDIFSANMKYLGLYHMVLEAKITRIKSTMTYSLLIDAYKDIQRKDDFSSAARLVAKILGIDQSDMDKFENCGNQDGSTKTIEFTYIPTGKRYAIQFPDANHFRYDVDNLKFHIDFEEDDRYINSIAFVLYSVYKDKYIIDYKRLAGDISNTDVLKDAFRKDVENDKADQDSK